MRVRFWGTRGSIATPGPTTVRYGGNTACVEVRTGSGTLIVLDCGTGARLLGQSLVEEARRTGTPPTGSLFIGHTHWDHIQGLPFFAPLFHPGSEWTIYGPRGLGQTLGQTLAGQMHYQYFPIAADQMAAAVTYHDLVEGRLELGDVVVTTHYLNHPAVTLGYRIEADGVSLAYACDHEMFDAALADGGDVLSSPQDARHVEFVAGVDLLIHDAQYLVDDYVGKRGWGHSTMPYVLEVARAAGVARVALFHHDPMRADDAVDGVVAEARARAAAAGYAGEVFAAAEGTSCDVLRRQVPLPRAASTPRSATYEPALDDLSGPVVVTARDPMVRAAFRAAAGAESLPVLELTDPTAVSVEASGVLVVDHDDERATLDTLRRAWGNRCPDRFAVLALTRDRPAPVNTPLVTDWLVWPASLGHLRTKLRAALLRRACRWQAAPLPADEPTRIEALHALRLLDTPAEERFDHYTREVCATLDVPFALVTLVDTDRQWFKSRQGIGLTESPRDESLCAHAILEPDLLHVPDLLADDRFADNPAVTHLHLRFYAGVPLRSANGSRVGTLCVADTRPRVFDAAQLATLRAMAARVQDELVSTRSDAGIDITEARL